MDINKLEKFIKEKNLPAYRKKQILDFYFTKNPQDWADFTVLSLELRQQLAKELDLSAVEIIDQQQTAEAVKYLIKIKRTNDLVEAVAILKKSGEYTLCISSQAGCPLGCKFCATGTLGIKDNLTASEIVDTVLDVKSAASAQKLELANIVYMGMGEPFLNYNNVKQSLNFLHQYLKIGWRKISVSTCGIVPEILQFAEDFPQVNLAVSLNAADDDKRSYLMPVNNQYPLSVLIDACKQYVNKTHRKLFFEYLVIPGFNDGEEDVVNLKKLLNHKLFHLNIISFHLTEEVRKKYKLKWKQAQPDDMIRFTNLLKKHHLNFTVRKSSGQEINAACGMLALKK